MNEVKLTDVYGITRDVPLNYIPRDDVDGLLVDSLTRDRHLVIFGSSKQGKTCLRKWNLEEDDYVAVTCSNRWDLAQLHAAILKQAGYIVEQSTTKTVAGTNKISAKFGATVNLGVTKVAAEAGGEKQTEDTAQVVTAPLELDPADVNDIIMALNRISFARHVVLEDFHYLPEETQKDFAVALKAFHEHSKYCFIVVGVWLDENRLIQFNGDLTGRVIAINADKWSEAELLRVIEKGEQLLNFTFDAVFKKELLSGCLENVYILQESCYRACDAAGVYSTLPQCQMIGTGVRAAETIRSVVESQSARYNAFLTNFATGFMKTQLEMYRWLLYPVLCATTDQLERGLMYNTINRLLKEKHPQGADWNPGNLSQALLAAASLQVKQNIKPIILDYNQSRRRLDVVDRGFLVWLSQQNKAELLQDLALPEAVPMPVA